MPCRSVKDSVADFFGVGEENPADMVKWRMRSMKRAQRTMLGQQVKPDLVRSITMESVYEGSHPSLSSSWATQSFGAGRPIPRPVDPLALSRFNRQESQLSYQSLMFRQLSRQQSVGGQSRRSVRPGIMVRRKKDSVARMAYDGVKSMIVSGLIVVVWSFSPTAEGGLILAYLVKASEPNSVALGVVVFPGLYLTHCGLVTPYGI